MSYTILYSKSADKALSKMQPKLVERIQNKIAEIAENPYANHNNATRLQGEEGYRLRVGDWRIIYEIRDNELVILVLDICSRGGAYKH